MKCYIGFSHNDNIVSKIIATKLGKGYSHVFMLFECNGEMLVFQATEKGVNARSWNSFRSVNKIVKLIEVKDPTRIQKAFHYCATRLGITYGFLAIIAITLGIHYSDGEKTMICSEYVARALDMDFHKAQDLVDPADIEAGGI